jgi:hypothetical protein
LQCPRSTSSWKPSGSSNAIRLPANQILQHRIGYLLKRPVGRPSNDVQPVAPGRPRKFLDRRPGGETARVAERAVFGSTQDRSVGGPELGRERDPIKERAAGCPHAESKDSGGSVALRAVAAQVMAVAMEIHHRVADYRDRASRRAGRHRSRQHAAAAILVSAARSQRSVASAVHRVQRFKGSMPQRFSPVPVSNRATVTPLSPPLPRYIKVQTDASVTIPPLILTPAQRVSHK